MKRLSVSLVYIFSLSTAIYLIFQLENLISFFWFPWKSWSIILNDVFNLIAGQGQNMLVGMLFCGIYWMGHRKRALRIAVFALLVVFYLYLVVDHVYYSLFFDHIRMGMVQGEANSSLLLDSIKSMVSFLQ